MLRREMSGLWLLRMTWSNRQAPVVLLCGGAFRHRFALPCTCALCAQVTARVRWADNMAFLRDAGAQHFLELGPGQVLAGLAKPRGSAVEVHVYVSARCAGC